jgi:hypothetical protein
MGPFQEKRFSDAWHAPTNRAHQEAVSAARLASGT